MTHRFPKGLTIKELKEVIAKWPETDPYNGEDSEVWIETGGNLSSPVFCVVQIGRSGLLLESGTFDPK